MSQSTPTKHDGRSVLFAVAELLVTLRASLQLDFVTSELIKHRGGRTAWRAMPCTIYNDKRERQLVRDR